MANHREAKAIQFEHDLIHRAIADSAFRQELVANPTAVVQRELTKVKGKLGDNVQVHILEETPWHVFIVLPPRGAGPGSHDPYKIGRS
jgi:hypothetical protein